METCKSCSSCGMPFARPEDHGQGNIENPYCIHCTTAAGTLKSYDEVLEGWAHYLIHSQGLDREAARRLAGQGMAKLPAWKNHNI